MRAEQLSPADTGAVEQKTTFAARLEPFDSYWQTPEDVEKGFTSFGLYYRANYLPYLPQAQDSRILVVSCGPGYLVNVLVSAGYTDVTGIDSDPEKIEVAQAHKLPCEAASAYDFLLKQRDPYDVIILEQELNHLTLDEQIYFLSACRRRLNDDGLLHAYGLNGANPLVGSENLSHNIDHFNLFTEYSFRQVLQLSGFSDIEIMPLKIYVFWKNPLNYVGIAVTGFFELFFRIMYKLYGKNVRVLSKKLAAVCRK